MNVFIASAALLTLLVVAWLAWALLRPPGASAISSQRLNATIYRDQLQVLERDLARGAISAADYQTTQDELQLRLLDDTADPSPTEVVQKSYFLTAKRTSLVIALLLPIGAASMYWWLGSPDALNPVAQQSVTNDQLAQMVESLAGRLEANPDNPQGWAMLARSYKVMGRLEEAEKAFAKIGDLVNTEPDLLVEYADLLAVKAQNNLEGKPLEMVNKALALAPQHPMGLMMSGVAAYRRSDFAGAVAQWEKLMTVLDPNSPDAQQVQADIDDARAKAGMPAVAGVATPQQASNSLPTPMDSGESAGKLPPVDMAAAGSMTPDKINQMVERLAERLKNNPDDLAGWARLARAYKVQGRLAEAEQAYAKAGKYIDNDPDLLAQYADLLAVRAGNNLEGKPLELVRKALALNPQHPMALMMAASAAYRQANYAQAIAHWEKVLMVLDPASSDAVQVKAEIADARSKAAGKP